MAKIEKIFDECIERMMRGESMESCLTSHPKEAAQLEPLLRTALRISWKAAEYEPRPGFQDLLRARLEGAHLYAYQKRQPVKTGGGFSLQRAWVPAMIAILAVIFSGAGTVAAASYSMPDQTLYPVKEATETVRLALTFSDTEKARVNVKLAETRSEEIAVMAGKGNTEQVGILTKKLTTHLQEAQLAISRIEEAGTPQQQATLPQDNNPPAAATPQDQQGETTDIVTDNTTAPLEPENEQPAVESAAVPSLLPSANASKKVAALKLQIENNINKNLGILENALYETPESTKEALQSAIDISIENYAQIQQELQNLEKLPKYGPGSPTNTKYGDFWKNKPQNEPGYTSNSDNLTAVPQENNAVQEQQQEQQQTNVQATVTDNTTTATPEPQIIEKTNDSSAADAQHYFQKHWSPWFQQKH